MGKRRRETLCLSKFTFDIKKQFLKFSLQRAEENFVLGKKLNVNTCEKLLKLSEI